jgi:hypothetical protein
VALTCGVTSGSKDRVRPDQITGEALGQLPLDFGIEVKARCAAVRTVTGPAPSEIADNHHLGWIHQRRTEGVG